MKYKNVELPRKYLNIKYKYNHYSNSHILLQQTNFFNEYNFVSAILTDSTSTSAKIDTMLLILVHLLQPLTTKRSTQLTKILCIILIFILNINSQSFTQ